MSRISVIIPIYNCEKYITACIDSVRRQTLEDLEVILVDDGSMDATADICRKYAKQDSRFVYLHQENRGVSAARNRGIEAAKSDYIMFVDADDIIFSDMCEEMLNCMEKSRITQNGKTSLAKNDNQPESNGKFAEGERPQVEERGLADLVFCGFMRLFYQDDELKSVKLVWPDCPDLDDSRTLGEEFGRLYETTLLTSVWGKLYRKDRINQMPFWFQEDLELGEDVLFNLEYLKQSQRIAVERHILYVYNQYERKNSLTRKPSEARLQISERLLEAVEDFARDKGIYEQVKERLWKVYYKDLMNYLEQFPFGERLGKAEKVFRSEDLHRILSEKVRWKRDTLVYRVCLGSGSRILVSMFAQMRKVVKGVTRGK